MHISSSGIDEQPDVGTLCRVSERSADSCFSMVQYDFCCDAIFLRIVTISEHTRRSPELTILAHELGQYLRTVLNYSIGIVSLPVADVAQLGRNSPTCKSLYRAYETEWSAGRIKHHLRGLDWYGNKEAARVHIN